MKCVESAESVTYIHRKKRLSGSEQLQHKLHTLHEQGKLHLLQGKVTGITVNEEQQRIHELIVVGSDKTENRIETDLVLPRLGNSPKLQSYTDWGLDTNRNQIGVDSVHFESSMSGVFVAGDINSYPAKRKLILCGFHEATLIAFEIAARMQPGSPIHTKYTTTNTELLARLGVSKSH